MYILQPRNFCLVTWANKKAYITCIKRRLWHINYFAALPHSTMPLLCLVFEHHITTLDLHELVMMQTKASCGFTVCTLLPLASHVV